MLLGDIFVFLFFVLVGSFFNVVLFRKNTGMSFVGGRSRCLSCNKELRFFENIPFVSFLVQGGRCRSCKVRLSWQYPLVELLVGFLGLLLWALSTDYIMNVPMYFFALVFFFCPLFLVAAYDVRTKIIDRSFLAYAFLGGVFVGLTRWLYASDGVSQFFGDVLVAVLLWLFFWGLWFLSDGAWMGRGDSDVAFVIGLALGFPKAALAILFGFWAGAAVGIVLIFVSHLLKYIGRRGHPVHLQTELPFAPFLAIGSLLSLFYSDAFIQFFFLAH